MGYSPWAHKESDTTAFVFLFLVSEQQQHSIADLSFFNTVPGNLACGYHDYLGGGGPGAQNCVDPLCKDSCFKLPTPIFPPNAPPLDHIGTHPSFHVPQPTVRPLIHICVFGKCMVCVIL